MLLADVSPHETPMTWPLGLTLYPIHHRVLQQLLIPNMQLRIHVVHLFGECPSPRAAAQLPLLILLFFFFAIL